MTQVWIAAAGAIVATDAATWIALSTGAIGVVGAVVGVVNAIRQARTDEKLVELKGRVDERRMLLERSLNAEEVLKKYREPLAAAAFDLQSRLYNILKMEFLETWGGSNPRAREATRTTLFRLAQYFGWSEILRRNIQFMAFPTADETKEVTRLQLAVTQAFLSHKPHGTALMIWSDEQRAIGERMIVEERGELLCMGYAAFSEACEGVFAPWCARLDDELGDEQAQERMKDVQAALCELVITLDPEHLRYPLTHLQPVEKLAE